jgi:hypothetical protein
MEVFKERFLFVISSSKRIRKSVLNLRSTALYNMSRQEDHQESPPSLFPLLGYSLYVGILGEILTNFNF